MGVNIAEHKFIFSVLVFYGFLFTLYTLSGGDLWGLVPSEITFPVPSVATADPLLDLINSLTYGAELIGSFFVVMFISPLSSTTFWWLGFLNWAILGTTIYLFIRLIRGV